MNEQESIKLITRVLANEASTEEQHQLEMWRKQDTRNEFLYTELVHIWNHAVPEDVNTEKAWEVVEQKLQPASRSGGLGMILRMAAAILVIGIVGIMVSRFFKEPSFQQIQTANNEIKQITLPDGSVVWLNQHSTLAYEKGFEGDARFLKLEGEAFFEVVKNPEKPFVITSSRSVTKVLGTSFNLNTLNGGGASLTVVTGKVSFTANLTHEEVMVMAGQSATIDEVGHATATDHHEVNALAWRTQTLSFKDASLAEVFKTMERYFEIRIQVDEKRIYDCHFTGEFVKPTLKQVMDVIGKTLQLTYEQKGKQVLVSGKGCN